MKNQKKLSQQTVVSDFLKKSENFALIKFDKTTHIALEGLRKELLKANGRVKVIKNTIFTKAINKMAAEKEYKDLHTFQKQARDLKENTAILGLGKDWSNGLNAFAKVAKTDKSLSFKLGFLDKTTYDGVALDKISRLPSKLELMGKIVGSMKSPLSRFVYAIKFPAQKFALVLNAKAKKA